MSYSTLNITRTKARNIILNYIENNIQSFTDRDLERIMDVFLEDKLYNSRIINDIDLNNPFDDPYRDDDFVESTLTS
jgi:hypothetical protein